jgi:predicted nucleotidyltransferase/DNA-binding XRE family transcriptional regulator
MVDELLPARLLRSARRTAGLTQVELAARAGVAQSVISAYEAGRRQPGWSTLVALVEATGMELRVQVLPAPRRLRHLSGPVGQRLLRHRRKVLSVAGDHGVRNVHVFGSVARGEDRPDSDVDLLVDLPQGMGLFGLGRMRSELEGVLGARVDIVPSGDLKPDVKANVERELIAL